MQRKIKRKLLICRSIFAGLPRNRASGKDANINYFNFFLERSYREAHSYL